MPRKPKTNPDAPPPKPVGGRGSVRTEETRDKICKAIELGATYKLACFYAGISEATFYDWKANDLEFLEAIHIAEGKGAVNHLVNITRASKGVQNPDGDGYILTPSWQASAWILERRYPDEYGRRVIDATVRGDKDAPLQIEIKPKNYREALNALSPDETDE
jgi:transposase